MRTVRLGRVSTNLLLALAASLAVAVPVARAEESGFRPVLVPVGYEGPYFQLTMAPGEEQVLRVEVGNAGTEATPMRTYAADVYTIVNGGFGARLFGEPKTGSTLWLQYPDELLELPAGTSVEREVLVQVPEDAVPGEHISSLVVENRDPIGAGGEVAVNQIIRQAIAVAITIPGPADPGLEIGAAAHVLAGDRSLVRVELRNTGNVRLRPTADMRITGPGGASVASTTIQLDSFYAFTGTLLEVDLALLLAPGRYTVDVNARDEATGAQAEALDLVFDVDAPTPGPVAPSPIDELVKGMDQVQILVAVVFAALAVLLLAFGVFFARRRRQSGRTDGR